MVFNIFSHSLPPAFPIKPSDQQLTFCKAPFSLLPCPSFLRSPSSPSIPSSPLRSALWWTNGSQQLQQGERGGVLGWPDGGVRVEGGHSTGIVIAVASMRGHRFPFKGCAVMSAHLLRPFSSTPPPPLTPLWPPLAPLFLGSQRSRQPRVNKVIPGVGQREFSPLFTLNSHQQQTMGPPHFTPLNPAGPIEMVANMLR